MSTHEFFVTCEHHYPVIIGSEATDRLVDHIPTGSKVLLAYQPATTAIAMRCKGLLAQTGVSVHLWELRDGEAAKTVSEADRVWQYLGECGFGRKDVIVGIGGGAATDFAGFIAATWLRGIASVYISTTVAGMVDAAIGGKTGLNSPHGKNLIGAFWSPQAVLAPTDALLTLPVAEVRAGLAEVIKCGFIADPTILQMMAQEPSAVCDPTGKVLPELIQRGMAVKAAVVSQDFRESHLREALNFGHTFGHAIEQVHNYSWRHGDAVAVGMVFAAELTRLANAATSPRRATEIVDHLRSALTATGLPTTVPAGDFAPYLEAMQRDKKARAGQVRFVTVTEPGQTGRLTAPDTDLLTAAFDRVVAQPADT